MFIALGLGLPILDVFIEFFLFLLLPDLVLADGANRALQLRDLLILERIVRVLLVQLLYQLSQVLLLLLHVYIVPFQVLVLLFCEDSIELLVKVLNLEFKLAIEPLHFAPVAEFAVAVGCSGSCHREGVAALVGVHALRGVHRTDRPEGVETQTGASIDSVL